MALLSLYPISFDIFIVHFYYCANEKSVFSFSFISKYFLFSLTISSLTHWLFKSVLSCPGLGVAQPVGTSSHAPRGLGFDT